VPEGGALGKGLKNVFLKAVSTKGLQQKKRKKKNVAECPIGPALGK